MPVMPDDVCWNTLRDAGLVPGKSPPVEPLGDLPADRDLLPTVLRAWNGREGAAPAHSRRRDRLRRAADRGACLTCGWPGPHRQRISACLGRRLVWWPRGIPRGRCVGILSSRRGRDPDRLRPWFAALRTACLRLDADELLLAASATAAGPAVRRAGQLFGIPVLDVQLAPEDPASPRTWGRRVLDDRAEAQHGDVWKAWLSPPVAVDPEAAAAKAGSDWPAADAAVVAASERAIALRVRRGGNLQRLLRWRLERSDAGQVLLAAGPGLTEPAVAAELLGRGAVGWYFLATAGDASGDPAERGNAGRPAGIRGARPAAPILTSPPLPAGEYLIHCTRRRNGPWPDETEQDHLDRGILDLDTADHSAFSTLCRIAGSQRLLAGCGIVRGDVPVISFTAVPLDQLHRLHTFRSHLSRWDFEPYGIAIRRVWLQQAGARPVIYGDPPQWDRLSPEEQPFFQKACSRSPRGTVTDWTVEREWRLVGDLDLGRVPAEAAFLFVPERGQAERLAAFSRWPVVVQEGVLNRSGGAIP